MFLVSELLRQQHGASAPGVTAFDMLVGHILARLTLLLLIDFLASQLLLRVAIVILSKLSHKMTNY